MSDKKPGLILTVGVMAQMLIENLDRPHGDAFRMAAEIIDTASRTPGLSPEKAEQWQRVVALYHAALLTFPPHDEAPALPDDWEDHQPPAEVYAAELPGYSLWVGLDADEIEAMENPAPVEIEEPAANYDDTARKPRVSFEP
jgi:hypothetical protein